MARMIPMMMMVMVVVVVVVMMTMTMSHHGPMVTQMASLVLCRVRAVFFICLLSLCHYFVTSKWFCFGSRA